MANGAKSFSQEEQDKLKELKNKFGADAVAEGIKTLGKTDEVRDRIKATQSQAVDNVVKPQEVEDKPTIVEEVKTEEVNTPTTPPKVEDKPTIVKDVKTPSPTDNTPKSIENIELGDALRDAFKRGNEVGKTKNQILESFKTRLSQGGYDVSAFDKTYGAIGDEFESLNQSQDDFYKGLLNGESYGSFYEKNSADFKAAKGRVDAFNSIDKSPSGIKLAFKSGALTKNTVLFKDLMGIPEYAEVIQKTQKEVLKNKIEETKDLSNLTFGELEEIADHQGTKYTISSEDIKAEIENDKELSDNKKGYLESTNEALKIKNEMNSLRGKIDRQYPNASEAFKNAIFNRESGALVNKYNSAIEEASLYENSYKFRMGEKELIWDVQEKEMKEKREIFKDLFKTKFEEFSADLAFEQESLIQEEVLKLNKKYSGAATSKVDKSGDLVFFNSDGKEINRTKNFSEKVENTYTIQTDLGDGLGTEVTVIDKKTNEIKSSYIVGEGPSDGKIFGGVKIKSKEGEILQRGDWQRNFNLKRPDKSTNIARDTNNPGNITADGLSDEEAERLGRGLGASGTYTSPNGREYFVFDNLNSGVLALKGMVKRQVEGNSSWATPKMSLEQYIIGYERGPGTPGFETGDWQKAGVPEGYFRSIVKELGAKGWERLDVFNPEDVATAIARAEGFGDISGVDGGKPWNKSEIAMAQKNITGGTSDERADRLEQYKELRREELTHNEAINIVAGRTIKDEYKDLKDLRKDFRSEPAVKRYVDRVDEFQKIEQIVEGGASGPGDMALVFSFMKGLDPTSVVRESEYALAAESAGALDRIGSLQLIQKWQNGEILTDTQKDEFVNITKAVMNVSKEQYNTILKNYQVIAMKNGLDQSQISVYDGISDNDLNSGIQIYTDSDGVSYTEEQIFEDGINQGLTEEEIIQWMDVGIPKSNNGGDVRNTPRG